MREQMKKALPSKKVPKIGLILNSGNDHCKVIFRDDGGKIVRFKIPMTPKGQRGYRGALVEIEGNNIKVVNRFHCREVVAALPKKNLKDIGKTHKLVSKIEFFGMLTAGSQLKENSFTVFNENDLVKYQIYVPTDTPTPSYTDITANNTTIDNSYNNTDSTAAANLTTTTTTATPATNVVVPAATGTVPTC